MQNCCTICPPNDVSMQLLQLSIKFKAMCAETSSNLRMVRFFLEIQDLLTTNPWFVTDR